MTKNRSIYFVQKGILYASLTLLFSNCGIQPATWDPPEKPDFSGRLALNERLTNATKIHLLGYYGAEEFVEDSKGNIYCGAHLKKKDFSSGAILKIRPDDTVEKYLTTKNWVTGMQFEKSGALIALMHNVGLVRINTDKSIDTLLTKTPNGELIKMGTGLKIASNGVIYFVNMDSKGKTSARNFNKLILEMKPTGGIYAYDPKTRTTTAISNGNYFGNGLEISEKEDFILISETSRYRILKYWIKGEKKGKSEILVQNLPGFPNNISRSKNGNFWVGFTTKRNDQLDKIHSKKGLKKFVYSLPSFMQPKPQKFGMVLEISGEGEILQSLFDSKGEIVTEAGAVMELNEHLYLGGDIVPYVSKSKL